jgi:Domain of unknown function (DUF4359)
MMKKSTIALSIFGIAILGLGGAMATTNPRDTDYEKYATTKLTQYLDENVCAEAGFLKQQCTDLLESGQLQLQQEIAKRTEKQNCFIFTIYKTELSVSFLPFVPSYHVETLGVFNSFHIYKLQKK